MSDGDNKQREIDAAIERYRRELDAEAALAGRDLDEIEDHMRELIDELRATMPLAEAIAAARQRFGEPGAVAREHAQVRTPFGTRLSRTRAWSVLALLLPFEVVTLWKGLGQVHGASALFWSWIIGVTTIVLGTYAALGARLTWARAFVLGGLPITIALEVIGLTYYDGGAIELASLAASVGAFALLVPWRRGEVTWAGAGLVLMAPAFHAATWMFAYFPPDGVSPITALGRTVAPFAVFGVLAGCAGAVLRARWAAPLALMAAPCLAIGASVALQRGYRTAPLLPIHVAMVSTLLLGAACAALAAVIQWRRAGSALGTLRSLR